VKFSRKKKVKIIRAHRPEHQLWAKRHRLGGQKGDVFVIKEKEPKLKNELVRKKSSARLKFRLCPT